MCASMAWIEAVRIEAVQIEGSMARIEVACRLLIDGRIAPPAHLCPPASHQADGLAAASRSPRCPNAAPRQTRQPAGCRARRRAPSG